MTDQISHRGPDDAGYWRDEAFGVGLGHRRLSIIDLSPLGHQPMISNCERYVIAFNGEIYNHHEIRKQLDAEAGPLPWRGHSDTEVMLAAIAQWGLKKALEQFNGMFAFSLWDRRTHTLSLARDRLGEKPLYYGEVANVLLFGSELKSLRSHPLWQGDIDRDALTVYLRRNCVPAPYSIYKGIRKLPPGTFITYSFTDGNIETTGPQEYWSARRIVESGSANLLHLSDQEATDQLEALLLDSVRMRMEADVPLGAFLSGGVDSSLVVALMQAQSSRPVKTFTIGFAEQEYNEADHARAVAKHLGTEHTELHLSSDQAMSVIPQLPQFYDEPFSDSSQIPTYLISRMAKEHVTVGLSGDGGDELFAGYTRYFFGDKIWRVMRLLPRPVRSGIAGLINRVKPRSWDDFFRTFGSVLPSLLHQSQPSEKMHKLAQLLRANNPYEIYHSLISHNSLPEDIVIGGKEPATQLTDSSQWPRVNDTVHHMMYQDMVTYLPDDILVKVDRASMATSLEVRVPLLDHRLVEFAWRIPLSQKIRNDQGKWLLREVLYRHVPRKLIERPKMGFGIPLDEWLRGPLRDWAEDLLSEQRIRRDGFFHPGPIRAAWADHISGRLNRQYHLWDILMFQAWIDAERSLTRAQGSGQ